MIFLVDHYGYLFFLLQQDDENKEEGGVKKVEECLSVMPQTLSTGDRRHSQVMSDPLLL